MKVWVLEVNDHPSLNIFFDPEEIGWELMTDNDIDCVDYYVKTRLVTDCIQIVTGREQHFQSLT